MVDFTTRRAETIRETTGVSWEIACQYAEVERDGPQIGQRVSYEDMANPLRHGVVCDIETVRWGVQYVIAWRDGTISTSDCRQSGWKLSI